MLTGSAGQVGHELSRVLGTIGDVVCVTRSDLDLADAEAVRETLRSVGPDVIVNAAAYTAVDQAEADSETCMAVNALAPGAMAEWTADSGALLVHYSTDYVFDGSSDRPYSEDDSPAPLNVYGESKARGEAAIRESGCRHLVFRTSWVYGARGSNFLRTMLRLAHEREEVRVVDDQVGAPTWSRLIAMTTAQVLGQLYSANAAPESTEPDPWGVYHLVADGHATWYEFAQAILERDPQRASQTCRRLFPISSADYPVPARRPANSRLETIKLRDRFGVELPHWLAQLDEVMQEL
jgi:dTDP-4-dehydrorhamnose reductase